jgi:hypothetical protein
MGCSAQFKTDIKAVQSWNRSGSYHAALKGFHLFFAPWKILYILEMGNFFYGNFRKEHQMPNLTESFHNLEEAGPPSRRDIYKLTIGKHRSRKFWKRLSLVQFNRVLPQFGGGRAAIPQGHFKVKNWETSFLQLSVVQFHQVLPQFRGEVGQF